MNTTDLLEAISKMKQGFAAMSQIWSQEPELANQFLENDYPFSGSFDELSLDVSIWLNNANSEINKSQNQNSAQ